MVKKRITKGRRPLRSPALEELLEFAHVGYWHTVIQHPVRHVTRMNEAIGILSYTTQVTSHLLASTTSF